MLAAMPALASANGLTVMVANHLAVLSHALARALANDPLPPWARETIVVQSPGLARWLTLELARKLGAAASLDLPFPAGFVRTLSDAVGVTPSAAEDRFRRDLLQWRVSALLDRKLLTDARFAALRQYLDDGDARKRWQVCARIADVFDSYQLYRGAWLAAWERGASVIAHPHEAWQAELWRRLVADCPDAHLARRLDQVRARLQGRLGGIERVRLPPRLHVFGLGSLPPVFVDLFIDLGRHVPVTLWLVSPAGPEWLDVRSPREALRSGQTQDDDDGHPLLASLARQGRDWLRALAERPEIANAWNDALPVLVPARNSLLHRIQADIAETTVSTVENTLAEDAADDHSLSIHVCHGERREVEVARAQILAAFADLPDLTPAEVIVLVPDVPRYAPFIDAVFGAALPDGTRLPYRVADRAASAEEPLAVALLALLDLAGGRAERSAMLAFIDLPAVRAALRLTDVDAERIVAWSERAGVRWGLDAAARAAQIHVDDAGATLAVGTWRTGLDRLLMGACTGPVATAVDDGSAVQAAAALFPVAAALAEDDDLLTRVAVWLDRLLTFLHRAATPQSVTAWSRELSHALDALLLPSADERDFSTDLPAVSATAVRVALAELARLPELAGDPGLLPAVVIREHLATALEDDQRANDFVTGAITVCGLKPLRTIPATVVIVLGMDDTGFPRRPRPVAFDLLAADPRPGDRAPREDDRQLFLEALLSARERFIVTYVGRDGRSNKERPPSVCVAELLDTVTRMAGADARTRVVVEHPLQPFSPEYFAEKSELFTFERSHAQLANALSRSATIAVPAFADADAVMTDVATDVIALDDLLRFWSNPAAAWCRQALGFTPHRAEGGDEGDDDSEPFAVDALSRTILGGEALSERLAEHATRSVLDRAVADGRLPLGELGRAGRVQLEHMLDGLAQQLGDVSRPAQRLDVTTAKWRVTGLLPAGLPNVWRVANVKPKDQLRAWIVHLLRQASSDAGATRLVMLDETLTLSPLPMDQALASLDVLVRGFRVGRQRPLPFFPATSLAAAKLLEKWPDPDALFAQRALINAWAEDETDAAVAQVWRGVEPLEEQREAFLTWAEDVFGPYLLCASTGADA